MLNIKVFVQVKSLGQRRPAIECLPIELKEEFSLAKELVEGIVRENVRAFNAQETDAPLFSYLTEKDMKNMERNGKIGFSDKKNSRIQDEEKAVENALQCYEDGIFRAFINEEEIEYGDTIELKDGDKLTFIRLTMMGGRLW